MWISEFKAIYFYRDKFQDNQCYTQKPFWKNKAKQDNTTAMLSMPSKLYIDWVCDQTLLFQSYWRCYDRQIAHIDTNMSIRIQFY